MSYARMQEEEARLRAEVERMFAESEAIDAEEDERYGRDRRGDELPPELAHRKRRLEKIREAKPALERRAKEEAKESGEDAAGPDPKTQYSFTDPDSRIMPDSNKAFIQGYSAQLAVDAEQQVIIATNIVQATNDKQQLIPMVEAAVDSFDEVPAVFSADAGYWSDANMERLEAYEIDAVVAPEKIAHREWREAQPPRGRIPAGLTRKQRMRRKLRTKRGRAEYDRRKVTAEPVCGQLKELQRMRQFLLRGLDKVQGEWLLACTGHNLLKLFRAKQRRVHTRTRGRPRVERRLRLAAA